MTVSPPASRAAADEAGEELVRALELVREELGGLRARLVMTKTVCRQRNLREGALYAWLRVLRARLVVVVGEVVPAERVPVGEGRVRGCSEYWTF